MALEPSNVAVVLTTIPVDLDAGRFSRSLLDERLAACVSVFPPMVSTYRWQGQVASSDERQVVIKTTTERLEDLQRRIAELHPYEVPELLVLSVSGGAAPYLAWLEGEVGWNEGGR